MSPQEVCWGVQPHLPLQILTTNFCGITPQVNKRNTPRVYSAPSIFMFGRLWLHLYLLVSHQKAQDYVAFHISFLDIVCPSSYLRLNKILQDFTSYADIYLHCFHFVLHSSSKGSNSSLNTSLPSPGAWPYSASDNSFSNVHSTSGTRVTHFCPFASAFLSGGLLQRKLAFIS